MKNINYKKDNMENLDFKNFKIEELKRLLPRDLGILRSQISNNVKDNVNSIRTKFTISEHPQFDVNKGMENLYLSIYIYLKESESEKKYEITIYSKDNHQGLISVIQELIKQV